MTLDMFVMWVFVGGIAGWSVGHVKRDGSYGLFGDISLGVIGSFVGSGLFLFLGVSPEAGLVALAVVAFLGAAALIFAQHRFWPTHA